MQYIVDRVLRQARAGVQDRDAPREARRRRRRQQAVGAPESSPARVEVRLNFCAVVSIYSCIRNGTSYPWDGPALDYRRREAVTDHIRSKRDGPGALA